MKNKESFLKELQNGLAVLAESEQSMPSILTCGSLGDSPRRRPSRTLATSIS